LVMGIIDALGIATIRGCVVAHKKHFAQVSFIRAGDRFILLFRGDATTWVLDNPRPVSAMKV
jgi:hypothetical protein